MNFNKFLKSLFGDKSSRDMKLIQPMVEVVKSKYDEIKASGFYDEIVNLIPEGEVDYLYDLVCDTEKQVYEYQNSVYGILDNVDLQRMRKPSLRLLSLTVNWLLTHVRILSRLMVTRPFITIIGRRVETT